MLKPLASAPTLFVRVFAGLTAMQIAIAAGRRDEVRRLARAIEPDLRRQDDYRTLMYDLLVGALASGRPPEAAHWDPIRSWFAERGWKNPDRALAWIVPTVDWNGRSAIAR